MKKKSNIIIFTANTGHQSIAEAIAESIPSTYNLKLINLGDKFIGLYTPFYQYFPQLFQLPYKLSDKKRVHSIARRAIKRLFQDTITKTLSAQKPDIVISTFFAANPTLEALKSKFNYEFINIITDPRTIHALLPTNSALNLTFDHKTAKTCRSIGIDPQNIQTTGWFVRDSFEKNYDKFKVRKKLGLPPNIPTYTIAAGSEGTNLVLKILPTFINHKHSANVIFACGNNNRLYSVITHLNKITSLASSRFPVNLIPLKFTHGLHQYLQASDLIIGKAGPNLIFESAATQTPFFAITHISGQEDGNLGLIKEYRLGYVEENLLKANRLISKIINNPYVLNKFQKPLEKMHSHNHQAKAILINHINSILNQNENIY